MPRAGIPFIIPIVCIYDLSLCTMTLLITSEEDTISNQFFSPAEQKLLLCHTSLSDCILVHGQTLQPLLLCGVINTGMLIVQVESNRSQQTHLHSKYVTYVFVFQHKHGYLMPAFVS